MKKISIKFKITIWYTIFMTLLVILVLWFLFLISGNRVLSDAKQRLKDAVTESFQEIDYEEGRLEFDHDLLDYLGQGIYLSVYDSEGRFLYGRTPSQFQGDSVLVMDELRQADSSQAHWYYYDYCNQIEGYGNVWIRGITSQEQTDSALSTVVRLALVLLPFLVLCIAAGGYLIIRRALAPLSDITGTAQQISSGKDLSQRICLGDGGDEVHRLAHTFDRMMDRLQESFENEKQFTSDVSHELRTPVSVILTQSEYALGEQEEPEEMRESLQIIRNQAKKMSALISQLLTLARADSGRQKVHKEVLNLSELAQLTAEELSASAAARNITVRTRIQPGIKMAADQTMMMRLWMNLISNSITYGKDHGQILVTLSEKDGQIRGSVEDDGIGIPQDQLDKIWNRFYQVDTSRSAEEGKGAGLGLPMVKWIVRSHGGEISVKRVLHEGSSFTFVFPVDTETDNSIS